MSVIEFNAVSKRYGGITALDNVSLALGEHRITGLLGRNGAGKSTFMSIATARSFASEGRVRVFGENPYENSGVLDRVCFIGENQTYPQAHKVRHVLDGARIAFPLWDENLARELVDAFGLLTGQLVRKLSRGQRSAVGVIVGLASRAPLTFFDEPYLGLDAVARQLFYDRLVADYGEHPRTIVLSTHLIDEVADLIEHVVVLDHGRVMIDSDADSLRGSAVVVSGPRAAVESFATDHEVLQREDLGGFARMTIRGASADHARQQGLTLEPVSLQQLVVRATTAAGTAPDHTPERVAS
ncbi:ATP-binding cassette domain-containing protein [Knoellia koreensis]|uniref:ABC transporter ATP-binding protein n=1 Tax=Knoellia koreensis TaxID=2730921 RepID=A0A849HDF3_9MICO|nr:ABC transporter ATP-binding protein [Knoellia sp. DB2414S]NNM45965.1 ABC transporter ATP-binding protein [Knoellia sp. DB2414S]